MHLLCHWLVPIVWSTPPLTPKSAESLLQLTHDPYEDKQLHWKCIDGCISVLNQLVFIFIGFSCHNESACFFPA